MNTSKVGAVVIVCGSMFHNLIVDGKNDAFITNVLQNGRMNFCSVPLVVVPCGCRKTCDGMATKSLVILYIITVLACCRRLWRLSQPSASIMLFMLLFQW